MGLVIVGDAGNHKEPNEHEERAIPVKVCYGFPLYMNVW